MNAYDKVKVACGVIAIILFGISAVIFAAIASEQARSAPIAEVRDMYPEIPKCDKELWLRIKDGCDAK